MTKANTLKLMYYDLNNYNNDDINALTRYYDIDPNLPITVKKMLIVIHNETNNHDANMKTTVAGKRLDISEQCISKNDIYSIDKKIGHGNFGTVFLVEAKNKEYAMKIMYFPETEIGQQDIMQELEVMDQFSMRGLGPRVYDYWICPKDNVAIVIMEKYEENLLEYADKSNTLNLENILDLMKQVHDIHILGFMHGDISAENILIKKSKNVKGKVRTDFMIGDFSLTRPIIEYYNHPEFTLKLYRTVLGSVKHRQKRSIKRNIKFLISEENAIRYPFIIDYIALLNIIYLNASFRTIKGDMRYILNYIRGNIDKMKELFDKQIKHNPLEDKDNTIENNDNEILQNDNFSLLDETMDVETLTSMVDEQNNNQQDNSLLDETIDTNILTSILGPDSDFNFEDNIDNYVTNDDLNIDFNRNGIETDFDMDMELENNIIHDDLRTDENNNIINNQYNPFDLEAMDTFQPFSNI